ncbi:hypothetical protein PINS_up002787 [Pythium insidiosum]|nr:hypothetical protein PINS_up002787 [Pythium insidiosum]
MAPAFPVPREELPQVLVSEDEYLMRKRQMQRMVAQLVHEFECYSALQKRQVDHRRWKQISVRENLRLYKERAKPRSNAMHSRWHTRGSKSSHGDGAHEQTHGDSAPFFHSAGANMAFVPMAPDASRPRSASVSTDDGTAATESMAPWRMSTVSSRCSISSSASQTSLLEEKSAECTAEKLRPLLLVGQCPGQVQDAMHALVTHSQDELAMVVMYLHEDVADCAILHTMEAPTEAEPYRYLGYKWFVKPSPAASRLLKNRDSLYVEYTGITKTRTGDVVGFHIMHSIDIPGFPEFRDRNCVRAAQSIRTLYHQVADGTVEVFMKGNIEIGGRIASPIAAIFAHDMLFGMPRAIECGQTKRLTALIRHQHSLQPIPRGPQGQIRSDRLSCTLCNDEKKSFTSSAFTCCSMCRQVVCSRCRVLKKVFVCDGILGAFTKVGCCKSCVYDFSRAAATRLIHRDFTQTTRGGSRRTTAFHVDADRQAPVSGPVRQPMLLSEFELADAQVRHHKRAKSSETAQNERTRSGARYSSMPNMSSVLSDRSQSWGRRAHTSSGASAMAVHQQLQMSLSRSQPTESMLHRMQHLRQGTDATSSTTQRNAASVVERQRR